MSIGAPLRQRGDPWRPATGEPATRPALVSSSAVRVVLAGLAAAIVIAPLAARVPLSVLVLGLGAMALAAAVAISPPTAAYLLLATTPLIVGIERGVAIPVLRPNEALLLLVGGALVARGLVRLVAGHRLRPRVRVVDASILAMAVTSSLLPLLWMVARGRQVTSDDVLYAMAVWKFFGVYLIIRSSIRTERQVHRCLWISVTVACVVAVVAILQALDAFGVSGLLARWYVTPGRETQLFDARGTATLGSSFAVADVMTFNLAIAFGLLFWKRRHRAIVIGMATLLLLGIPASGQLSGIIGLAVGVVAIGLLARRFTRLGVLVLGVAPIAGLVFRPVVAARLSDIDPATGLPESWIFRLRNLRTHFWPELFSNFNFVLGVRPSARIRAPESWRDYVWIESGHTWLLWSGGIPLFLAFWWFLVVSLRKTAQVARARADAIGIAALASFSGLCVIAVLMILDPHLTLRGTADLLFALLALACTTASARRERGTT
jgi:hypothetical protein